MLWPTFSGSLIFFLFAFCPLVRLSPVLCLGEAGINSGTLEWTECTVCSHTEVDQLLVRDVIWGTPRTSEPNNHCPLAGPLGTSLRNWKLEWPGDIVIELHECCRIDSSRKNCFAMLHSKHELALKAAQEFSRRYVFPTPLILKKN